MNQKRHLRILALVLVATCGCQHHRGQRSDCSRIDTCKAAAAAALLERSDCPPGVTANFPVLKNSGDGGVYLIDSLTTGRALNIGLHDCCCIAALHSPIANLIDKQRKAICCEVGCVECVDRYLAGQAAAQRNKSAADAGELFLRMVEVTLQRQLLDESFDKLVELESTVLAADENGIATEEQAAELEARVIALKKNQAEVDSGELQASLKLNLLLGIDSCNPRPIQPCFDLSPQVEPLDIDQLVILARTQRPELAAMKQMGKCPDDENCMSLISQIDPRLGIGLTPAGEGSCLTRLTKARRSGLSCCTRRKQLRELCKAREELVRQEVIKAALDAQSAIQQLALENEDLVRLEQRRQTIEAAEVLDSSSAFVDSLQNWVDQQSVKSRRISNAISFEIAQVRLREATGNWIAECGLCSSIAGCSRCRQ